MKKFGSQRGPEESRWPVELRNADGGPGKRRVQGGIYEFSKIERSRENLSLIIAIMKIPRPPKNKVAEDKSINGVSSWKQFP